MITQEGYTTRISKDYGDSSKIMRIGITANQVSDFIMTPYELLNNRKPNIAYFWVFGCKCYILKKGTRLSKFEKKCDEGFLLGYSTTSKA